MLQHVIQNSMVKHFKEKPTSTERIAILIIRPRWELTNGHWWFAKRKSWRTFGRAFIQIGHTICCRKRRWEIDAVVVAFDSIAARAYLVAWPVFRAWRLLFDKTRWVSIFHAWKPSESIKRSFTLLIIQILQNYRFRLQSIRIAHQIECWFNALDAQDLIHRNWAIVWILYNAPCILTNHRTSLLISNKLTRRLLLYHNAP